MFKSEQVCLPKAAQKPDGNKNSLEDHENIFTNTEVQEKE